MSSSHCRRDDRLARQELDPGDADDEVHIVYAAGSHSYHEDEDCRNLSDDAETVPVSREGAQRRWKGPCGTCIELVEAGGE